MSDTVMWPAHQMALRPWQRKALLGAAKAILPFADTLRRMRRACSAYAPDLANDEARLDDAIRQIETLRRNGISVEGATVVEIGTGWIPIVPLIYRLAGAAEVISVDQERLLDARQMCHAMEYIEQNIERIASRSGLSGWHAPVYPKANDLEAMLADQRIRYLAPANLLTLPEASADLIVSRAVLEHIPPRLLMKIIGGSREILRAGGHICHLIDMSDHWEHQDKSISRLNFLAQRGPLWWLANLNSQNYQNRLRRAEFIALFERAGFDIIAADGEPDQRAMESLRSLDVIPQYRTWPPQELAVLVSTIIARRAP